MRTFMSKLLLRPRLALRRTSDGRSHIAGVPDELAIEIDHHGSPVTKRPAEWFICFVPGLKKQWWHRFTHPKHKHVFALKMIENNQWVIVEPWWTRIMVTTLPLDEAVKFLRWGAAGSILKVTERIPGRGSQTRGWTNCAVLISFMLGRSYWTWTPHGLYQRLSSEDGVHPIELTEFLEEKLVSMTQGIVVEGLGDPFTLTRLSPEAAFMELGKRICKIMFSQSYLSLHRLAVSEAVRFPDATRAFFVHGPHQIVASVKTLILHFYASGQFRDCDPERTSQAFLSMLRANLYLETVLGCRSKPNEIELESHTKSVVEVFLRGTNRLVKFCGFRSVEVLSRRPEIIATQPMGMIRSDNALAVMPSDKSFPTSAPRELGPMRSRPR